MSETVVQPVSVQRRVEQYLAETGRKKKWLAAQLGISAALLSQWLSGRSAFSEKRIQDILTLIND